MTQDVGTDDCKYIPLFVDVRTTACKDTQNNVWRLRVQMASSECDIEIHTVSYRNTLLQLARNRLFPWRFGNNRVHTFMKKLLLPCLTLLTCLSSLGGEFNFWPESREVECSVVLTSEPVEAGKPFPDFTLVFTNKSRKEVRLLDSFYPSPILKPDIILEIWDGEARVMPY